VYAEAPYRPTPQRRLKQPEILDARKLPANDFRQSLTALDRDDQRSVACFSTRVAWPEGKLISDAVMTWDSGTRVVRQVKGEQTRNASICSDDQRGLVLAAQIVELPRKRRKSKSAIEGRTIDRHERQVPEKRRKKHQRGHDTAGPQCRCAQPV
jgi:hypothetical protein